MHNPYLFVAIFIGFFLMLAAVYLPFLNNILNTAPLEGSAWLIIMTVAVINILMIELVKNYYIKREGKKN